MNKMDEIQEKLNSVLMLLEMLPVTPDELKLNAIQGAIELTRSVLQTYSKHDVIDPISEDTHTFLINFELNAALHEAKFSVKH